MISAQATLLVRRLRGFSCDVRAARLPQKGHPQQCLLLQLKMGTRVAEIVRRTGAVRLARSCDDHILRPTDHTN